MWVDRCDREIGGSDADATGLFPVKDKMGAEGRFAVEIGEEFVVVAIGEDSQFIARSSRSFEWHLLGKLTESNAH